MSRCVGNARTPHDCVYTRYSAVLYTIARMALRRQEDDARTYARTHTHTHNCTHAHVDDSVHGLNSQRMCVCVLLCGRVVLIAWPKALLYAAAAAAVAACLHVEHTKQDVGVCVRSCVRLGSRARVCVCMPE